MATVITHPASLASCDEPRVVDNALGPASGTRVRNAWPNGQVLAVRPGVRRVSSIGEPARLRIPATARLAGSRHDEARLVGGDDGLGAIAQAELAEQPADVR